MFRGTLVRLALWYLLLFALIVACFNLIVYLSLSQALQTSVFNDLQKKAKVAIDNNLKVTGNTIDQDPTKLIVGPNYADVCVVIEQFNAGQTGEQVVNGCSLYGVKELPERTSIALARQGTVTKYMEVSSANQTFAVRTEPLRNHEHQLVGAVQVAKPISWIGDTLERLKRLLAIASAVAMVLGALVALLMASKSLGPIRAAFQKQRDFVADASHELRTPLTLIRTNAEAWLRRSSGGPGAVYARNVVDETDQLSAIVRDLTTLALADARQLRIDRKPVEVSSTLRALIEQFEPVAEQRGVTIQPELDGGVTVQADPSRLRQLFLILLDNAVRYSPDGGAVTVGVASHNGRVAVTVVDRGIGISSKDLPHIFERFYRADKARSRESGGSGLGLAIAKWIADVHKGDIEVRSTPGTGTTVTVTFPVLKDSAS
jgi:signal transduction histidine kinase